MNIVHISDIHFRRKYESSKDGYKRMLTKMQNPLIPLSNCIENIQKTTSIDLLIISGDLTEDGHSEDYRYLKESIRNMTGDYVKIVVTLGNHDIKSQFRIGWLNEEASEQPYNCVESFKEFEVIAFDNSVWGNAEGHISEEQFDWLQDAFERAEDKPIIFVTHHHLLESQSNIARLPESDRLLNMLRAKNVLCILNGHTHHSYTGKAADIPYFTVSGMSFTGEDEGSGLVRFEERYGYNVYQVENGQLVDQTCKAFQTGKVLQTVDMTK